MRRGHLGVMDVVNPYHIEDEMDIPDECAQNDRRDHKFAELEPPKYLRGVYDPR